MIVFCHLVYKLIIVFNDQPSNEGSRCKSMVSTPTELRYLRDHKHLRDARHEQDISTAPCSCPLKYKQAHYPTL